MYIKFPNSLFRARWPTREFVLVDQPHLNEYFNAPDTTLSFVEGTRDYLDIKYLYGDTIMKDLYHVALIRGVFTKNISVMMDGMVDEIDKALQEDFPETNGYPFP